jgi:hypothetical protein
MPNFPVDPPRQPVANQVAVYHAQPYNNREPLGKVLEPDLVVDVTDLNDKKREMLAKHASQRTWLDESQGLDSYLDTMTKLDEEVGRMTGLYKYAEGWRRHLPMGFCDPEFDPLREALKARVLVART